MENQKGLNKSEHQQSQQLESMLSVQLLPQDSALHLQDNPSSKEKRLSAFASVNNFIKKTYAILQEKRFQTIVSWAQSTDSVSQKPEGYIDPHNQREKIKDSFPGSFKIHNLRAFEQVVLPQYFKHSNMSSFVRQLNMYNFHKVRGDKNEIEFEHEKFKRNKPQLLSEIRRKQVESTVSIPSIALIPHEIAGQISKEEEKQLPKEPVKGTVQVIPQQFESPQKKESSLQRANADQQQSNRLKQLLDINKTLKRQKQIKSNQLKQLSNEAKLNMANKFNKTIISLIAAKIQQDLLVENEQIVPTFPDNSFGKVHQMIGHIMDSNTALTFKELLEQTSKLFQSEVSNFKEE